MDGCQIACLGALGTAPPCRTRFSEREMSDRRHNDLILRPGKASRGRRGDVRMRPIRAVSWREEGNVTSRVAQRIWAPVCSFS